MFSIMEIIRSIIILQKRNIKTNNVLCRTITIFGGDISVILKLQSDCTMLDRNNIIITIEGKFDLNKENFTGALIFQSDDNIINDFVY